MSEKLTEANSTKYEAKVCETYMYGCFIPLQVSCIQALLSVQFKLQMYNT